MKASFSWSARRWRSAIRSALNRRGGSWSKGRTERYGYYHCPKCAGVRGRRETVEKRFLEHLEALRPEPGYVRLFRAVVLEVWRTERAGAEDLRRLRAQR